MTDLFLDIWTFAFSQIGLIALGVLAAPRLRRIIAGEHTEPAKR